MRDHVKELRTIASRGRVDDADVQVLFDAADELEAYKRKAVDRAMQAGAEAIQRQTERT